MKKRIFLPSPPRFALFAAILWAFNCGPSGAAAPRPNILLIFTDDQGIHDVGCYGSEIPVEGEFLFDLAVDPGEEMNLAKSRPEIFAELRQRWDALASEYRER